jgi:hypothetical protein
VEWTWEVGTTGLDLAGSWREWLGNAEGCLCREFDLVGKEAEAYCGRAAGFTTKVAPFDLVSKAAKPPRTTKLARPWNGLQAIWRRACLVAGRVAKGGRGRRELDEIRVSIGAMGDLELESDAARQVGVASAGDLASRVRPSDVQSMWALGGAIRQRAEEVWRSSAAKSMKAWKQWAVAAVERGGRKAHAFSKSFGGAEACLMSDNVALVGKRAMEVLLAEWMQRWTDEDRARESARLVGTPVASTMDRITLEELDAALGTYPERVGLGFDCLHPRSLKMLPVDYRLRLLDIMHESERSPARPQDWLHLIVFLLKPTGGLRPIGRTISLLRVWSRIRSKDSRRWESEHDTKFFWGVKGRACDAAGWCHNVLAGIARHVGFEVATLFGDIEKFYEFVSHGVLNVEGDACGFPPDLLRALCGFYAGPRVAVYDGVCSQIINAGGTILAGCSCATALAKVLVYILLSGLAHRYPSVHLKNVVDDISLQEVGTRRLVVRTLGEAGKDFARGIRAAGGRP